MESGGCDGVSARPAGAPAHDAAQLIIEPRSYSAYGRPRCFTACGANDAGSRAEVERVRQLLDSSCREIATNDCMEANCLEDVPSNAKRHSLLRARTKPAADIPFCERDAGGMMIGDWLDHDEATCAF